MSTKIAFRKSFSYAWNGMRTVWKEEINFKIEVVVAFFVILALWFFNFSFEESAIVILMIIIVLAGEMVNTAIEDLCNKIEPNENLVIKKIKDIMAGFVLIGSLGSIVVGIMTVIHHFL